MVRSGLMAGLFSVAALTACATGPLAPPAAPPSVAGAPPALAPRPDAPPPSSAPPQAPRTTTECPLPSPAPGAPSSPAQPGAPPARRRPPDGPLTEAERTQALDRLTDALQAKYVFPDLARKATATLRTKRNRRAYDPLATGHAFADTVTADLDQVLNDLHFRVLYRAEGIQEDELRGEPSAAERALHEAEGRYLNGGFERVERLPGNIGYIALTSFSFPARGARAAAAAMELLADTDALIIDVRHNPGGDPDLVATLCSYFFPEPVHLNDIYDRPKNATRQYWTSAAIPGRRYLDRPIYVLISRRTFSGAEEFAYDLQQLKRATLVGETTGGGANPGEVLRLSEHLAAFIPTGRAINPVSRTNWERIGVKPDLAVPADDALRLAQIEALQKVLPKISSPERKVLLEERLKQLGETR
ncbi:S41 family peptidase [Chondromyces crocatus]|uniref:Tail specific protease domain-containing protein n=1 Tax=Chondromyces crocatus TaxID=52 RepID=A0A0K1EKW0_CHOCO|nr:S41 family peptidase [Chondromyces crocatus]AKT41258.1 uncharacterized protein CMC5_054250 [Chondromyces crocatus]